MTRRQRALQAKYATERDLNRNDRDHYDVFRPGARLVAPPSAPEKWSVPSRISKKRVALAG